MRRYAATICQLVESLRPRTYDPCQLAWQVNQVEWLENSEQENQDSCQLAWQVNQVEWLSEASETHSNSSTSFTCRTRRQGSFRRPQAGSLWLRHRKEIP
jgi:hypothetical protein